jgi:hypothetical protein
LLFDLFSMQTNLCYRSRWRETSERNEWMFFLCCYPVLLLLLAFMCLRVSPERSLSSSLHQINLFLLVCGFVLRAPVCLCVFLSLCPFPCGALRVRKFLPSLDALFLSLS